MIRMFGINYQVALDNQLVSTKTLHWLAHFGWAFFCLYLYHFCHSNTGDSLCSNLSRCLWTQQTSCRPCNWQTVLPFLNCCFQVGLWDSASEAGVWPAPISASRVGAVSGGPPSARSYTSAGSHPQPAGLWRPAGLGSSWLGPRDLELGLTQDPLYTGSGR